MRWACHRLRGLYLRAGFFREGWGKFFVRVHVRKPVDLSGVLPHRPRVFNRFIERLGNAPFFVFVPPRFYSGASSKLSPSGKNVRNFSERDGWRSLRNALASIWRMRSRVTSNCLPISSKV